MKRIIMAVSAAIIAAFTAAIPVSTAWGNPIKWSVDQGILNELHEMIIYDGFQIPNSEILGITVYLFPATYFQDFENTLPNAQLDVGQAYGSIELCGSDWETLVHSPEPIEGNLYSNLLPVSDEIPAFLLFAIQCKNPDSQDDNPFAIFGAIPDPGVEQIDLAFHYKYDNWVLGGDWEDFEWPYVGTFQIIPEPATGLLVLGGAAVALLRRRRR